MSEFGQFKIPAALYPIRILQDKFHGKFSGGAWIAYHDDCDGRDDDVWNGSQVGCDKARIKAWPQLRDESDEIVAKRFWSEEVAGQWWIAVGDTPNEALTALLAKAAAA